MGLLFVMFVSRIKCLLLITIMLPTLDMFRITGAFTVWGIVVFILFAFVVAKGNFCGPTPFNVILLFEFSSFFLSYLLGSYNGIGSIFPFVSYILLVVLLWQLYIPSIKNVKFIIYAGCIYYSALSIYGAYESITFSTPFIEWMTSIGYQAVEEQGEGFVRFGLYRAQSFTPWCCVLGLTCGVGYAFMSNIILYHSKKSRILAIIIVFLLIAGVLFSGDRTAMLMTGILSISLFPFIGTNKRIFFLLLIVLLCIYLQFQDYFDEIYFAFAHSDEVVGSSTSMRMSQLEAAIRWYNKSPLWGNGLSATVECVKIDPNILGAESIVFQLLINRGLIGIASFVFFIICTCLVLLKKRLYTLIPIFIGFIVYETMALPMCELYILCFIVVLYKNQIVRKKEKEYSVQYKY